MDTHILFIFAIILLCWLLIILTSIILFGIFVSVGWCIKEMINCCGNKYCKCCKCCICVKNTNKREKIELV